MKPELKPIAEQVIVITGASSGIGLATALLAAEQGAKLVLAARSAQTLESIAHKINSAGGQAVAVECDVADRSQTDRVAQIAIDRYGRIDTWVNNAGSAIYGRLDEITNDDNRRLFETNFWGVCNGSLSALPYLKRNGGALINVGSEVSETVMPLLGMYSASKHAVKGFTDALRIEIEQLDDAPVSITLIQPTAVNTPFPQHARNYMDEEPALPQPTIEPQKVGEAILKAATTPTRSDKVGTMSVVNTMVGKLMPGIGAKIAAARVDEVKADRPPRNPLGALHQASECAGPAGVTHGVN